MVQMTGNYPLDIGGPATVAYHLASRLVRRNVRVSMIIRIKEKDEIDRLRAYDEFRELEKNVDITPVNVRYDLAGVPGALYKLLKITKNFEPSDFDIIHYNSPPVDVTVLYPLKSRNKCKQTIAIHGGLFYESRNFIGRYIMKKYSKFFSKIIVLNNFSKRVALKAGLDESKMVKIPNGVDIEYFNHIKTFHLEGDPSIVYAGRLAKIKGVDVLIKAFYHVSRRIPESRLYIIGGGKEEGYLRQLAEKLKLKNIEFKGYIPFIGTVHQYIKSADIFVLPSYRENFSISLLEAMAAKTPIVASDAEGNLEVLSYDEALFFHRGDSEELADKIVKLAQDKRLRSKLSSNAYNLAVKQYSWDVVVDRYLRIFEEVTS